MFHKFVVDVLFWLHMAVILFGVFMGLLFSFPIVLLIIGVHRTQFLIFKDCLISKLQKRLHGIPLGTHFLQFAVVKMFGKEISERQAKQIDYFLLGSTLAIALLNSFVI
ncbi:hypothetical protein J4228_04010 [Candidatus Woesearchaeota archaeon]|nr:hypothetical protein [Candidatus Woesearchaeota archaeon]